MGTVLLSKVRHIDQDVCFDVARLGPYREPYHCQVQTAQRCHWSGVGRLQGEDARTDPARSSAAKKAAGAAQEFAREARGKILAQGQSSGFTKTSGHGLTSWQNKPIHAHRLAWILKRGPIENGLCVNHKCRHPTCCNPEHMYLGSRAENMFDRFYRKPMHTNDSVSEEAEIAID
jgi:hypothetical protein